MPALAHEWYAKSFSIWKMTRLLNLVQFSISSYLTLNNIIMNYIEMHIMFIVTSHCSFELDPYRIYVNISVAHS